MLKDFEHHSALATDRLMLNINALTTDRLRLNINALTTD